MLMNFSGWVTTPAGILRRPDVSIYRDAEDKQATSPQSLRWVSLLVDVWNQLLPIASMSVYYLTAW